MTRNVSSTLALSSRAKQVKRSSKSSWTLRQQLRKKRRLNISLLQKKRKKKDRRNSTMMKT
jgi:hypothetical protein